MPYIYADAVLNLQVITVTNRIVGIRQGKHQNRKKNIFKQNPTLLAY